MEIKFMKSISKIFFFYFSIFWVLLEGSATKINPTSDDGNAKTDSSKQQAGSKYMHPPKELSYQERVIVAIDCGAKEKSKSTDGFIWDAVNLTQSNQFQDIYYSRGSKASDYRENTAYKSMSIKYTNDTWIYKSERHSEDSFIYEIPVYADEGTFVLILKFAELYFGQAGARVFNIKLGDQKVIENLDIYKEVGRYAALDVYIEFEIKEDEVFYKGNLCSNAFKFRDQVLVVEFEKTHKDNPKVDGIILFEGTIHQTNYESYLNIRKKAEEQEALRQKDKPNPNPNPVENLTDQIFQTKPPHKPLVEFSKLWIQGPGLIVMTLVFAIILILINMESVEVETLNAQKRMIIKEHEKGRKVKDE